MKKFILLSSLVFLLSLQGLSSSGSMTSFAAVDTDGDGVSDEIDLCPHVYSRSETGCPTLTSVASLSPLNVCYSQQNSIIIARIQPICDTVTKVCPVLSSVSGVQTCDILFPLILKEGKPFVR